MFVSFSVRKVPLKEEILVKTSFIIAFSSSAKQLIHTKCCAMRCRCLEQNLKGRPSMELKSREQFTLFRSGRISSVYIVGWLLLVVGHTFSKLVNFECVGVLGVC